MEMKHQNSCGEAFLELFYTLLFQIIEAQARINNQRLDHSIKNFKLKRNENNSHLNPWKAMFQSMASKMC
jgi:hypothetical protein